MSDMREMPADFAPELVETEDRIGWQPPAGSWLSGYWFDPRKVPDKQETKSFLRQMIWQAMEWERLRSEGLSS